ncbi:uncharacterized protein LOC110826718 isoform X3 [Zootermopsis nevadensis]|uniref:uncharacterized protein LOC110826718 isoform X3 n=1 Tax=Zootermopsis nevadensis TaxID=136037 RepID=UPI000B8E5CE5|nr:uncharacterized protein LOC110826718 isoform X3 [Zootermopsis nevadensis]
MHTEDIGAMSGEADNIGDVSNSLNGTGDSEVSGLSHVDAPSDGVYIVCGVVIAMILVAGIIVLLALFISKLRKRDENSVRQDHAILHSAQQQNNNHCNHNNNNSGTATPPAVANGGTTIPTVSATVIYPPPIPTSTDAAALANGLTTPRQFIWQNPATHPYALYSNDKETLVHPLPSEQPGFCRGFRKNLQGRWKRLVKRKPINETYAIPPELRDQLKNIYVY